MLLILCSCLCFMFYQQSGLFSKKGVWRCLCLARLLNRSGCRFVTFFVPFAECRFFHFSLLVPFTAPYTTIHSAAFSNTQQAYFVPHTLAFPLLHAVLSFRFSPSLQQHPQHSPAVCLFSSPESFLALHKSKPLVFPFQFHR